MEQEKRISWFELTDAAEADTPALLVYPERVQQNSHSYGWQR